MPLPSQVEQTLRELGISFDPATKRDRLIRLLEITPMGYVLELADNRAFVQTFLCNPDISAPYIEKHNLLEEFQGHGFRSIISDATDTAVDFLCTVPASPLASQIIEHFLASGASCVTERQFFRLIDAQKGRINHCTILVKRVWFNQPTSIRMVQLLAPSLEDLTNPNPLLDGRRTKPIQVALANGNPTTCAALAAYAPAALKAATPHQRKAHPGITSLHKLLPLRDHWTPEELLTIGTDTIKQWATWKNNDAFVEPAAFLTQFNITEAIMHAALRPNATETWPTDNPQTRPTTIEVEGKLKFIRLNPTTALEIYGPDDRGTNHNAPSEKKLFENGYKVIALISPERINPQPLIGGDNEAKAIERTLLWGILGKFDLARQGFWSEIAALADITDSKTVKSSLTKIARLASPIFEEYLAACPTDLSKTPLEDWRKVFKILLAPVDYQIKPELLSFLL